MTDVTQAEAAQDTTAATQAEASQSDSSLLTPSPEGQTPTTEQASGADTKAEEGGEQDDQGKDVGADAGIGLELVGGGEHGGEGMRHVFHQPLVHLPLTPVEADADLHPLNPEFGDIEPMDGGKISGVYVETLDKWEKA